MEARSAAMSFGEENFATAPLGGRRRARRLVRTADLIAQHPGGTLPDKLNSPAALKGLYRLARAPKATHQAGLDPHRQRTLRRSRKDVGVVVVIHDTAEFDLSGKKSLKRLDHVGKGKPHRG